MGNAEGGGYGGGMCRGYCGVCVHGHCTEIDHLLYPQILDLKAELWTEKPYLAQRRMMPFFFIVGSGQPPQKRPMAEGVKNDG